MPAKMMGVKWGPGQPRRVASEDYWRQPLRWNAKAKAEGVRKRVFCASLADWLDPEIPLDVTERLLNLIAATPWLDWMLLTKRPENFERILEATENKNAAFWLEGTAPINVWLGVTIESQKHIDRYAKIAQIPAVCRFISCEPLLSEVDVDEICDLHRSSRPDLVIVGGESGPNARPCELSWIDSIESATRRWAVKLFVKQLGANSTNGGKRIPHKHPKGGDMAEWPPNLRVQEMPEL